MKILRLLFALCFLFYFFATQAQSDSLLLHQKVMVKMNNGEHHDGLLIEKNDQFITLENPDGTFNLLTEKIKKIEEYSYPGMYQYPNNHDTRYFITPSAIPLEKGNGFYSNFFLITNAVNYGISNNFSIGVATEMINTFVIYSPIWSLNAKAGFWVSEKVHLGGGISWTNQSSLRRYSSSEKKNELIALIPYTVITLGYSESNISLGVSYNAFKNFDVFYHQREYIDQRGPILSVSGVRRLTPKISIMSENNFGYLDDRLNYAGIHGIQIHYKKNTWNLGLLFILSFDDSGLLVPFLGYSIMF